MIISFIALLLISAFVCSGAFTTYKKVFFLNQVPQWKQKTANTHLTALSSVSSLNNQVSYYNWKPISAIDANIGSMTSYIMIVNVVFFLLQQLIPSLTGRFVKDNWLISRGQVHRLLTSTLIHSNLMHLLANITSLRNLEWVRNKGKT